MIDFHNKNKLQNKLNHPHKKIINKENKCHTYQILNYLSQKAENKLWNNTSDSNKDQCKRTFREEYMKTNRNRSIPIKINTRELLASEKKQIAIASNVTQRHDYPTGCFVPKFEPNESNFHPYLKAYLHPLNQKDTYIFMSNTS